MDKSVIGVCIRVDKCVMGVCIGLSKYVVEVCIGVKSLSRCSIGFLSFPVL